MQNNVYLSVDAVEGLCREGVGEQYFPIRQHRRNVRFDLAADEEPLHLRHDLQHQQQQGRVRLKLLLKLHFLSPASQQYQHYNSDNRHYSAQHHTDESYPCQAIPQAL